MDVLEFVAASEWPAVTAAGLWWYHETISTLLANLRLTKVTAFGAAAEFRDGLDRAEVLSEASLTITQTHGAAPPKGMEPAQIGREDSSVGNSDLLKPQSERPSTYADDPEVRTATHTSVYDYGLHQPDQGWHSPRTFIMEKFYTLEAQIQAAAQKAFGGLAPVASTYSAASQLGFSAEELDALQEMATLRDRVTPAESDEILDLTWQKASRYNKIADRLKNRADYLMEQHLRRRDIGN